MEDCIKEIRRSFSVNRNIWERVTLGFLGDKSSYQAAPLLGSMGHVPCCLNVSVLFRVTFMYVFRLRGNMERGRECGEEEQGKGREIIKVRERGWINECK